MGSIPCGFKLTYMLYVTYNKNYFSEKSEKRFSGLLASGGRDKKEIETQSNIMDLVARKITAII